MKKILLFTDNLGAGGAQRQLVGLAVMLQEKGFDVKVCTYTNIDFYKHYLDDNNVSNIVIPNACNPKKRILAVRKYFLQEKPDWVIAYQETPSLIASLLKLLGCKYRLIVSERNTTQKITMNERIRFMLYHFADYIVPNSYAQEKFLLEHRPWMKAKLNTITNFVDLDKFAFIEHQKREVPLIIVAATLFESKNALGLIEAVKILKDRGCKFTIEWYGKIAAYAEYIDKCEELINKYELQSYIKLCDKTKEIHKKYAECDFFCLPSFFEGTPNVICEAISCGRPVLCSDVCDNSIYVHEGKNGTLFNPKSPESIANAIERILSINEQQYIEHSKNSRKIAKEKLSAETFVNKYLDIINRK